MLRFSISVSFDGKVNLVGANGGQNLKFSIVLKSAGKNK